MSSSGSLIVVMKLPKPVAKIVQRAREIVAGIGDHPSFFPKPPVSLAVVSTHIDEVVAAQTAFQNHVGTRTARDAELSQLLNDLARLRAYVSTRAIADVEHALVIVTAAAMFLRRAGSRSKSTLSVKQVTSGVVRLVAKAVRAARAYEWQTSPDGLVWSDLRSTAQASTVVDGLTPGKRYWFRFRVMLRSGWQDWSDPVCFMAA